MRESQCGGCRGDKGVAAAAAAEAAAAAAASAWLAAAARGMRARAGWRQKREGAQQWTRPRAPPQPRLQGGSGPASIGLALKRDNGADLCQ